MDGEVATFSTLSRMVHPGLTSIHLGKMSHSTEKEAAWPLDPGCSKAGPCSGSLAPAPSCVYPVAKPLREVVSHSTSVKYKGASTQVLYTVGLYRHS